MTIDLLTGGALVVALVMPWWHTSGPVSIRAPIKVHDTHDMDLVLTVNVGLDHVNVTLVKLGETSSVVRRPILLPRLLNRDVPHQPLALQHVDLHFNEQIRLSTRDDMKSQLRKALARGLPVPILTVMRYFCHQEEGFRWSYHYRQAGYFCQFTLTLTLVSWAWMNVLFMAVPRYGALAMALTGLLGLLSVLLYWLLLPPKGLVIHLNGSVVGFDVDRCFWIALSTGAVAVLTGGVLYLVDVLHPGSLAFDLEIDHEVSKTSEFDRKIYRLQPADSGGRKLVLRPRISLNDKIHDSGASKIDTTSVLEQIATIDGSYFRSTVTNVTSGSSHFERVPSELVSLQLIHTHAPKAYGYTFRQGRELPSFHESTISLNSDSAPRFVDSASEETAAVHRLAGHLGKSDQSLISSSSSDSEWQDPLEDAPNQAIIHAGCDEHDETFCSTLSTTITTEPSPRRRTQRAHSLGYFF